LPGGVEREPLGAPVELFRQPNRAVVGEIDLVQTLFGPPLSIRWRGSVVSVIVVIIALLRLTSRIITAPQTGTTVARCGTYLSDCPACFVAVTVSVTGRRIAGD